MLGEEEFDSIFKEYYYALKLYARRFVIDTNIAGDIVQDVFCNIWVMKNEFTPRGSMKSYLFSAVYYKCLNHIKHEKLKARYNEYQSDSRKEFESFYMEAITGYEDSLLSSDLLENLKTAMEELPDQCRRIFLLSRKFGLKNREIADFLQISIKVVERQISKALNMLHDRVSKKAS